MDSVLPLLPLILLILIVWYVARKVRARDLAASKPPGVELYGVGSWLALFIYASLSLAPLVTIGQTASAFRQAEEAHAQLLQLSGWQSYKVTSWSTVTVMLLWQIVVAWRLKTRYIPSSVRHAKLFLLVAPALYAASDIFSAQAFLSVDATKEGVAALIKGYASCLIWFWYLSASKRVRNTYYRGTASKPMTEVAASGPQADFSISVANAPSSGQGPRA